MPLIVAFEGIAGTGKTTICDLLAENYPDSLEIIEEFPQDFINDYLRLLAKSDPDFRLSKTIPTPLSQTFLFATNAAFKMEKAMNEKDKPVVILDRYKYSILAHQLVILKKIGFPEKDCQFLSEIISLLPDPDMTVYFDGDVELMKERLTKRSSIYNPAYFDFIAATKQEYEDILGDHQKPILRLNSRSSLEQNYQAVRMAVFNHIR